MPFSVGIQFCCPFDKVRNVLSPPPPIKFLSIDWSHHLSNVLRLFRPGTFSFSLVLEGIIGHLKSWCIWQSSQCLHNQTRLHLPTVRKRALIIQCFKQHVNIDFSISSPVSHLIQENYLSSFKKVVSCAPPWIVLKQPLSEFLGSYWEFLSSQLPDL